MICLVIEIQFIEKWDYATCSIMDGAVLQRYPAHLQEESTLSEDTILQGETEVDEFRDEHPKRYHWF